MAKMPPQAKARESAVLTIPFMSSGCFLRSLGVAFGQEEVIDVPIALSVGDIETRLRSGAKRGRWLFPRGRIVRTTGYVAPVLIGIIPVCHRESHHRTHPVIGLVLLDIPTDDTALSAQVKGHRYAARIIFQVENFFIADFSKPSLSTCSPKFAEMKCEVHCFPKLDGRSHSPK